MTGNDYNRLYKLDTDTGAATPVGNAVDFGPDPDYDVYSAIIASGFTPPAGFAVDAATGEIYYTGASAAPGVYVLDVQVRNGSNPAGAADDTVDDTTRVTVTVPDLPPLFSQDSYEMSILPGVDGSSAAETVGAVTATDPEGRTVAYSLRPSDPDNRMYMTGRTP